MAADIPIVDSHVHLYPKSELDTLPWCLPGHPLAKQQSVEQYRVATADSPTPVSSLIIVEAARRADAQPGSGGGWAQPLREVEWMARVAGDQPPRTGEGHASEDGALVAALVPWAPLPSGATALEQYLEQAQQAAGEACWRRVRGFRYLVQDKPDRTMLGDGFVEGLRLLGRRGYTFDLGIDQHGRGRVQLEEAVEMIDRAHEGMAEDEKVTIIISQSSPTVQPT
jgi:L-rhamnono-1,4-lactonase